MGERNRKRERERERERERTIQGGPEKERDTNTEKT